MKTKLPFIALILLAAGLTGCVGVSIGSRRPPDPSAPPVMLASADAATVAEIDAAARLSFDSSRLQVLSRIAKRGDLSPAAQVHLVNVGYRSLSFEDSKVALLRSVIANPAFCDTTRHAIVTQLGSLSFDNNKQAVLNELNNRVTASK
jgi:hypothetical protein